MKFLKNLLLTFSLILLSSFAATSYAADTKEPIKIEPPSHSINTPVLGEDRVIPSHHGGGGCCITGVGGGSIKPTPVPKVKPKPKPKSKPNKGKKKKEAKPKKEKNKPERKGTLPEGHNYHPAPKPHEIEGIPKLKVGKNKTNKKGGGERKRYVDKDKNIYEWDSQHGELEKYNRRGKHQGAFDPKTGKQTKPANPQRRVEP